MKEEKYYFYITKLGNAYIGKMMTSSTGKLGITRLWWPGKRNGGRGIPITYDNAEYIEELTIDCRMQDIVSGRFLTTHADLMINLKNKYPEVFI